MTNKPSRLEIYRDVYREFKELLVSEMYNLDEDKASRVGYLCSNKDCNEV